MATYYPDRDECACGSEIENLNKEIERLKQRNKELNVSLMLKSAEASEAQEELKRCKLEWEIVADQKGHNMCHKAIAVALKRTIGYTGKYPDPDNVSPEEFAQGCIAYHRDIFPDSGIRLEIAKVKRSK